MSTRDVIGWFFLCCGIVGALYGAIWRGRGAAQRAEQNGIGLLGLGISSTHLEKLSIGDGLLSVLSVMGAIASVVGFFFLARALIIRQRDPTTPSNR